MKMLMLSFVVAVAGQSAWSQCNPATSKVSLQRVNVTHKVQAYAFSITIDKTEANSFEDTEKLAEFACSTMSSLGEMRAPCKVKIAQPLFSHLGMSNVTHKYHVSGSFKQAVDGSAEDQSLKNNLASSLEKLASTSGAISNYDISVIAESYKTQQLVPTGCR